MFYTRRGSWEKAIKTVKDLKETFNEDNLQNFYQCKYVECVQETDVCSPEQRKGLNS